MAIEKNTNDNFIVNAIESEVKRVVKEKYDNYKKYFLEQLEKDEAETLAGVSLFLMKKVDIQLMGEQILITLRTENK